MGLNHWRSGDEEGPGNRKARYKSIADHRFPKATEDVFARSGHLEVLAIVRGRRAEFAVAGWHVLIESRFTVEVVPESVSPPSVISSTALKPVVLVRGAEIEVSPACSTVP